MGNFGRDNRSGGDRHSFGGGRNFGGRGGGDRQMHRTTCSKCGKDCEVPFKPTGVRPVFCSDCFEKNGGQDNRRFSDGDRSPRRTSFDGNRGSDRSQNTDQFTALNVKLDKILALLTPKSVQPQIENVLCQPNKETAIVVEKKKRTPRKVSDVIST